MITTDQPTTAVEAAAIARAIGRRAFEDCVKMLAQHVEPPRGLLADALSLTGLGIFDLAEAVSQFNKTGVVNCPAPTVGSDVVADSIRLHSRGLAIPASFSADCAAAGWPVESLAAASAEYKTTGDLKTAVANERTNINNKQNAKKGI